jgi:hypothetical protein
MIGILATSQNKNGKPCPSPPFLSCAKVSFPSFLGALFNFPLA